MAEPGNPDAQEGPPASEEELRARIEEQVRRLRVQDLLLETAASVLNLSARRIGKEDERDLEQARVGIEAVRALVGLLDAEPASQVREALSQVQMMYAQQAQGGGKTDDSEAGEAPRPEAAPAARDRSSGLWTPPGS
jgi:hypothetical protein